MKFSWGYSRGFPDWGWQFIRPHDSLSLWSGNLCNSPNNVTLRLSFLPVWLWTLEGSRPEGCAYMHPTILLPRRPSPRSSVRQVSSSLMDVAASSI